MLRRISLIAASAAMLAVSALPASAATTHVSTHKIHFPSLRGVRAWGTYIKTPKFIRVSACAEDMSRADFAVGAVALGSSANNAHKANLGAVAIGYHQTVCRTGIIRYTAHLRVYTFIANNKGRIVRYSKIKKLY